MSDTHYDIAVIGAGAAGLGIAFYLSEHAHVVVLEREEQPAYHSSGRSAAMYIEGYENPEVAELTSAGRDFFYTPPEVYTDVPLLHPRGGMTAAGPGELDALQRYLDAWQPMCPELKPISADECRERVPILKADWVTGGAFDPTWLSIDVHALLMLYQRGIKDRGGDVLTNKDVQALKRDGNRWTITTAGGSYEADIVVNAAGAWAGVIGQLAGLDGIELTPMRRTAAIIPPPENSEDWPLVHTIGEELYFKPESPGLMICPQDETPSAPMDAFPEEMDIAVAADRFLQVADHPVERIMHQWAGLRTFAPDRRPVVGFDPRADGFFWLAGQGGFGVQTSPGLGERAAQAILTNSAVDSPIAAERFVG